MVILTLMRVENLINQDCHSAMFHWVSARFALNAKGVSWEILAGPCEGFVHRLIRNQSPAEIKPSLAPVRIDSSIVFRYSLNDTGCVKTLSPHINLYEFLSRPSVQVNCLELLLRNQKSRVQILARTPAITRFFATFLIFCT